MRTKVNVLVVDDDDAFWALMSHLIDNHERLGELAMWTRLADGEDVVPYLERQAPYEDASAAPRPHLILLDQRMPRSTGTEVLARLKSKAETRNIPVCLVSSSNDRKQVDEAYRAGASFCITKPLSLEELREKLEKIVDFFTGVAEPAHV